MFLFIGGITISVDKAGELKGFLENNFALIDEDNNKEEQRFENLKDLIQLNEQRDSVLETLDERKPVFILFNNYFKVKPSVHLAHLVQRTENNLLDDAYYDYGNLCLLKLLGFTARELSELGNTQTPKINDTVALKAYKDKLDSRSYGNPPNK